MKLAGMRNILFFIAIFFPHFFFNFALQLYHSFNWNFCLRLFLAEMRLNVFGMCTTEAVCVLLSSTSSRKTSTVDV